MARVPRARVPKTSGQGVSRLGYQKGYKLKGGAGAVKDAPAPKPSRSSKLTQVSGLDTSVGDVVDPTGLVNVLDTTKPSSAGQSFLKPTKPKKPFDMRSGYAKGKL